MFDQAWIDYLNEQQGIAPLQPMAPPGSSYMPAPPGVQPWTGGNSVLPPELMPPPPPPVDITDPSKPAYEASMGGNPWDKLAMKVGGGGDDSWLGNLFGGGGGSKQAGGLLGDKDWGSMLMALGGGIAQGATFGGGGWAGGLGRGFQGAAAANIRAKENAQEEAYRQQLLDMRREQMEAPLEPTELMRHLAAAGYEPGSPEYQQAVRMSLGGRKDNIPSGFDEAPDGSLTFKKGGPNDPEQIGKEAQARGKSPDVPTNVRSDAIKADQAYKSLMQSLDDYEGTVKKSGNVVLPGAEKDAVNRKRRNIQLQMKELYNLGVLNGPDMMLMDQMLFDPNASLNPWSENFGLALNPGDRVKKSVEDIKEMMRQQRNSKTQAIGMPDIPAAENDPLGIR
jgi:hypothetical protein